MNVSKKLITRIIQDQPEAALLSDHIFRELSRVQSVQASIVAVQDQMRRSKEKFEKDKSAFEESIRLIQKSCKHEDMTHYPDAAGGSDSFDECNICGHRED